MNIHPTAIISKSAKLASGVEVGPYSIIEDDVQIGEGTIIENGVRIHARSKIGKKNRIHQGAVVGGLPQDIGFDQSKATWTEMGDNNTLREYVNVHRSTKVDEPTRIGDNNYFMGNVHIAHDCIVGNHNIVTQGTAIGGHVHIGNKVFISGLVTIHQFCVIGDQAMIGSSAKVLLDVPPYVTADGNPAMYQGLNSVGLKRTKTSKEDWEAIKDAYRIIYKSGLTLSLALAELNSRRNIQHVERIIYFLEKSKRGIINHA